MLNKLGRELLVAVLFTMLVCPFVYVAIVVASYLVNRWVNG